MAVTLLRDRVRAPSRDSGAARPNTRIARDAERVPGLVAPRIPALSHRRLR